jgi:ligand-binding SRPBCC domain-containing protein
MGVSSNLERITPPTVQFRILTPSPITMHAGAVFDYVIRLRGLPMRWTTLISDYEPPHRFVDVQLRGPYSFWHHTHTFEAVEGGTRIGDSVRYLLPFGPLGALTHGLFVRRDIEGIFQYRQQVIPGFFGLPSPPVG